MSDLRARAEAGGKVPGAFAARDMDANAARAVALGAPTALDTDAAVRNGFAVADLDESGVAASEDVPVHVAWRRMMQDVQWLGKERQSRDYRYRGIDDVMNLVGPAERKHGVFVMPVGVEPVFEVINTKSGSPMNYARITCHFLIYGPRGDSMAASVLGEGFDTGDKSGTKAQSVALRTLYLNALAIQTSRPEMDTEHGVQHEIAGPPARTPADYAAEILDDTTSIARLQQIKAELDGNPRLGHAMVSDGFEEGSQIELGRLVRRVGAKRVADQ